MKLTKSEGAIRLLATAICLIAGRPDAVFADSILLVERGAVWRYLDDGSDQAAGWRDPAFDDGAWAGGRAPLGYGDGDERTVVGYGPDPGARFITTYFRHEFNVDDPQHWARVKLRVVRDDGAVVCLNGAEIYRTNMPAGEPNYLTLASSAVSGSDENRWYEASVSPAALVAGRNVLAVEIHQSGPTSSDVTFDCQLLATTQTVFVTRGPYLQRTTPTSATIRWRTDLADDAIVWYGDSPANLTSSVGSAALVTEHEFELSDLSPATRYYYAIGDSGGVLQGDATHTFVTHPPVVSPTPVRIWAHGDFGTGDMHAENVRDAYSSVVAGQPAEFWLALGDNAYESGLDIEYTNGLFDVYGAQIRRTTMWPLYGNHDAISSDAATQAGPYFTLATLPRNAESGGLASGTEAYYSFDYGDVHVVCLDSAESSRLAGGPMMTWLAADLAASPARWLIAAFHHPPYTKGSHNSDNPSDSNGSMRDMRQIALPILEQHGVDLVLGGHSHAYERSYLLDGHYGLSTTLLPSMILNSGDGGPSTGPYVKRSPGRAPHEGAVYAVVGSGGKLSGGPLNHPAMFTSQLVRGSLLVDVAGDRLDARFIDEDGLVADAFTIIKGAPQGDLDLDCDVDIADLARLLSHFGESGSVGDGDINQDQTINLFDLAILLSHFGDRC
ncbi:MAG: metallophosphoesterase [Planctomycetes bacterium]|nr:metallophosphoesterase [Planctomycetota bacterium]